MNKQYIDQKINLVVEPMTLAFFASDGKKTPIEFFLDFLKDHYGNRPGANEADRIELDYLRGEVNKLKV